MRVLAVTWVIALAACSKPAPAPTAAFTPQPEAQDDAAVANAATTDAGTPRGVPDPHARQHVDPLVFPSAFQRHWGLTPADCDISRPEAKGLMKISGKTIDFPDATATVRAIVSHSQYRIVADMDFKAGERTWQRRETLELQLGDTHLLRTEPGGRFLYEHC